MSYINLKRINAVVKRSEDLKDIIYEALGTTAAEFMHRTERGVDIVMPTTELENIAKRTIERIERLGGQHATDTGKG